MSAISVTDLNFGQHRNRLAGYVQSSQIERNRKQPAIGVAVEDVDIKLTPSDRW